jgi:hypothetical protein
MKVTFDTDEIMERYDAIQPDLRRSFVSAVEFIAAVAGRPWPARSDQTSPATLNPADAAAEEFAGNGTEGTDRTKKRRAAKAGGIGEAMLEAGRKRDEAWSFDEMVEFLGGTWHRKQVANTLNRLRRAGAIRKVGTEGLWAKYQVAKRMATKGHKEHKGEAATTAPQATTAATAIPGLDDGPALNKEQKLNRPRAEHAEAVRLGKEVLANFLAQRIEKEQAE